MASVNFTKDVSSNEEVVSYSWSLGAGDTGAPLNISKFPDKTVHVTATFGSATLRGSNKANPNDATAGDWFNLTDPQGNAITLTSADGKVIAQNPLWISPITTGGSAYTVTVVGVK